MLAVRSPSKQNAEAAQPQRKRKSSHGFPGVRGGQGPKRDKFQGCLPYKKECTELCDTPEEAAAALRRLQQKRLGTPASALPDFGSISMPQQPSECDCWPEMDEMREHFQPATRSLPTVGIGSSMWPLPVGSNPNSHGCEVVVAQYVA